MGKNKQKGSRKGMAYMSMVSCCPLGAGLVGLTLKKIIKTERKEEKKGGGNGKQ
jgi:hypothetical protein